MTTIGTKAAATGAPGAKGWRLGSGGGRRGEADTSRVADGGKLLAKSMASLAESERMLARQSILLAELRADGSVTTEAEKSLLRLEAGVVAQRAAHDGLLAKAAADEAAADEDSTTDAGPARS